MTFTDLPSFWVVVAVALLIMIPLAWRAARKSPPEE